MKPDFHHPMQPPPLPPPMNTHHLHRKWIDLAYATPSMAQKLDIYLPETGDGPFPVIAAIHGGAWEMGDKGDMMNWPMLTAVQQGYAVACINYRLSHEAKFPAQIFDCKAAIRFLRANATQYHLDPTRIIAWGGSAGGHLCALLGTSAGVTELEDLRMGNPQSSSSVQAVVDWYGPAESFLNMDTELRESGLGIPDHSSPHSPESRLLGRQITEIPTQVAFASPLTYITPEVPFFLIQHGRKDPVVPVQQSLRFAEALERIAGKDRIIIEILEEAEHGDPAFETPENLARVFQFLDSHFQ